MKETLPRSNNSAETIDTIFETEISGFENGVAQSPEVISPITEQSTEDSEKTLAETRRDIAEIHEEQRETLDEVVTMNDMFERYNVTSPIELSNKFNELDKALMESGEWDYQNDALELNEMKWRLEAINPESLSDDEALWRDEMLGFWNHHAASMALFGYRDNEAALRFVEAAKIYSTDGHWNKMTDLFGLLAKGDVVAAEQWAAEEVNDYEKGAAEAAIRLYQDTRLAAVR